MKLGLISDTHDNVPMITKAVAFFKQARVDRVLHAGDFVSPFSLKPFFSLGCEFLGVWGNNDGDKIALQKIAPGKIENSPHVISSDLGKILLAHDLVTVEALARSQEFLLIVHGHTHQAQVMKQGRTLVVNPGECGAWVNGKSTIAIVDLEAFSAQIIELAP
jgi:uncharacterized protein